MPSRPTRTRSSSTARSARGRRSSRCRTTPCCAPAASSPTSRRSGSWRPRRTATLTRRRGFCRGRRTPAASTGTGGSAPRYALQGYWAGSTVHGDAEAIDTLQRSNVHSFQRPDSTDLDLRSVAHVAERLRRVGWCSARSAASASGSRPTSASRVPGFDINDIGFMRRADQRDDEQLDPGALRHAVRSTCAASATTSISGRAGTTTATGSNSAVQRQRARDVHEQLGHRHRRQPQPAAVRRPRDPRRARASIGNRQRSLLDLSRERRAPAGRPAATFSSSRPTAWARRSSRSARRSPIGPSSFLKVSAGIRFSRNHDESQWVEDTDDGHYVFGRLRPEDRRPDRAVELHRHAGAVDSGVHGAVRLGRRLLELQGAGERPVEVVRRTLRAVRVRRQPRLQLPLVPDDQRAALGIQARLDAVRRLAAGTRGHARARRLRLLDRTSAASSTRRRATCS